MAVKFNGNANPGDIARLIAKKAIQLEQVLIADLQKVGESFVSNARTNGSYKDRTGNLRNSVGYIILKNGESIFENFQQTVTGTIKGKEVPNGVTVGEEFAQKAASEFPSGIVLIVVAGMNYAVYVESKGFDVITGSSQLAETDLQNALNETRALISQMK
jgi:hypothetical protein